MKNVLLLGATGKLGKVLLKQLIDTNFNVTALVRNSRKLNFKNVNLKVISGNVTDKTDIEKALLNVDVVISVLGHGFRTSYPVQEETMKKLIPLMEKLKIKRLITITGAGLKVKGDPKSLIADLSDKVFSFIDPYRMLDAKKQQILLEKSSLDWTTVRTPIHSGKIREIIISVGLVQPYPWKTISRLSICDFIINCVKNKTLIKKSPIIF